MTYIPQLSKRRFWVKKQLNLSSRSSQVKKIKFIQCKYEIMQYEWNLYNTNEKLYNTNENYTIQIGKYTI